MTAIAIEKYTIKGFPAPRTITSEAQNDHYTEVLYNLEHRGHLSAAEEKYAELLTVLIEAYEEKTLPDSRSLACTSADGIDGREQPQAERPSAAVRFGKYCLRGLAWQEGDEQATD